MPISGPLKIPNHVFEVEPEIDLAGNDTVAASGFKYDRIRVRPASESPASATNAALPDAEQIGRPSTFEKAKEVLDVLWRIESNRKKSAAMLHADFKSEFQNQFPLRKYQISAPSERTLRIHLKRYRQELAESGKN